MPTFTQQQLDALPLDDLERLKFCLDASGNVCVRVYVSGGGGGAGTWGSITGTLSDQTDLQNALNAKVPTTRTVSTGTGLTGGGALSSDLTIGFANLSAFRFWGNVTAGSAAPTELTAANAWTILGVQPAANSPAYTGDVTKSSGALSTTIAAQAVTYAKMQNVSATQRVHGRNTAGAGVTEEVTLSQLLDWVGSATNGDILYRSGGSWTRLPIGSATNVLTVSGGLPVWQAPSGGGSGQEFERAYQDGPGITGLVRQYLARQAVTLSQLTLNPFTLPAGQQELVTTGTTDFAMGDAAARTRIAQTFTANASYVGVTVSLRIKKTGTPADNFKVSFYSSSSNLPNASLAACSFNLPAAAIGTSYADFTFQIPATSLTSATVYAMVAERTGAVDGSNYYQVEGIATGGAAGAQECLYNGSAWSSNGTNQLRYSINGGDVYDVWKRADDTAMAATDSVVSSGFGLSISSLAASRLKKVTNTTSVSADDRVQVRCQATARVPSVGMETSIKN